MIPTDPGRRFATTRFIVRITLVVIFVLVAFTVPFTVGRPRPAESVLSAAITMIVCLLIAVAVWWI